ncbi:Flap endonuclease GEN-like protein 1 [Sciurus carolinensis]|uniref:Flap endonuclease GEN-like protein 1 n=1 Tax=Sciurus carolinensis TaxID=30640 RepID=A0AA41MX74_SCICA|nr:Flap endonuclease GEN-like protein 1 [Sciurus carolinensis]
MGVNNLWQILEPVKQHIHLQNLSGKTIAVDLSLWVCEAQTVKKMIGTVTKPHLRNLFFRISCLTQMDVKLVFVMEGEPPKLKADVMSKRNQIRYGPSGKEWSQKTGRSHFKSVLRECLDMLECLGIPWVQATGEAEAMCAHLNASGQVDGCLTNDGDAFLYGAQTVYRNFTMSTKVIQEFLLNKDKLMKVIRYQRPDLLLFQRFTFEKMDWPNPYACEKLLVLLTLYDMRERKLEHYALEEQQHGELLLLTIEEESLFEAAYPEIVAVYQKQKIEIKGKKQKNMKIKPKENTSPESDDVMSFQSLKTLKPSCKIFPKQNAKVNLEISPDPPLPQESISASSSDLLLPQNASCLNTQQQMSSRRPSAIKQIKNVSRSLISESNQPSASSCNISVITDLHLSAIDWEGTSFSNSPAIKLNTLSPVLPQSELESHLSAIPNDFGNIPQQLSCESEWCTTNINKVLDRNLQKISPEEHLLSGINDLYLQDIPLKKRIQMKSSYPQDNVQPDIHLKTLCLPSIKESHIDNSSSDCLLHLSKDLSEIHLQNESRNSNVLTGDQLFQENCEVSTSVPYPVNNPVVKTTSIRVEPPYPAIDHSRKVDRQTTQKIVMKNSACLDKHSSDVESAPVFGKAKCTTQKMSCSSQKHIPTHFKEHSHSKLCNPKMCIEETELCVNSYKTAGNEEKCFLDTAESSQSFLQSHKKDRDPGTYLDSPLPLSQRLKVRFQNT